MDTQPDELNSEQDTQHSESSATESTALSEPFSWQAPEGPQAVRSKVWYIGFAVVVVGLMVLAIVVLKSVTFAVLIAVMAAAVVMISSKEPRIINYGISPKGIYIGDKLYDYSEFRAFGVIQDPGFLSIIVLPVKRFSPGLTLYFSEADGERIVDLLGTRLPIQDVKPDFLEKVIRLIKL